ncbi:MAG: hypothetical protein ACJ8IR_09065 [Alphaproteobacteria bacterium]
MLRQIGGAVAGIIVWIAVVIVLNTALRRLWPDYAAVEKAMAFTLPMMIARLSMSGVSSVLSGGIAAVLGRDRLKPALVAGIAVLLFFVPVHYSLWSRFPVWYHLTFLSSLVILSVAGGRLARGRRLIFQSA